MRRVESELTIGASPDAVFAFVAELDNLPTWQADVLSAEQTTSGPTGVGTTARVLRELMGQRMAVDVTVTAFDQGRRLAFEGAAAGLSVAAAMDLAPAGDGTLVRASTEIRARSPFMAALEGMAAGIAQEELATGLQRLKAAIEAT
jgi:uncharacterized protein YndB with AHSA1/START domain